MMECGELLDDRQSQTRTLNLSDITGSMKGLKERRSALITAAVTEQIALKEVS